ncbi:TetR/AcrR family transcriptional regulator [Bacillus kwashiorkori]|uniref:TetR/AcrR family transcriptional regulator n=1 Tax=Bacillus kwashiorkori TaxID=1522318 RepID=UPI000784B7F9|nr:TetR/AcrR family transcriptional regulator [Bacillus kwashiorkori]
MDGFARRREMKKQNILDAALQLFMEYGVQKVSIAEIAKNATVSQVTIYNYFESKDNLVQEVFKYYVDQIWQEQKRLLQSDLPFSKKLKRIMFGKTQISYGLNEKFFQDLMKDYASGQSYISEIYENEALPMLVAFFNEGKQQGIVDSTISVEAILIFMQMFTEFMQKEEVASQLLPYTEELTKLFFYGIVGRSQDEPGDD